MKRKTRNHSFFTFAVYCLWFLCLVIGPLLPAAVYAIDDVPKNDLLEFAEGNENWSELAADNPMAFI